MNPELPLIRGRGSHINPANRYEALHHERVWEDLEFDREYLDGLHHRRTHYLVDASKSVVTENNSPDIGFRFSINPYRGCAHGCSYCYARPYHEFLGYSAGLDFETKILVKHDAAALLREFLQRPSWKPEPIIMSGITDPYQPAEREFKLTRGCLEVALEARQPIGLITKNALIVRDLDLLSRMAALQLVHANISITTLDNELSRAMEPRCSIPAARLRAVRALRDAGVPVRVMIAPIIPGLNDEEIPKLLEAARDAGAMSARYTLIRLPLTVEPVFLEWLQREQPLRKDKIESRIRSIRGGKLNESRFKKRMRGTGAMADQIGRLFKLFMKRYGLEGDLPPYDCTLFRPPTPASGQGWLF